MHSEVRVVSVHWGGGSYTLLVAVVSHYSRVGREAILVA